MLVSSRFPISLMRLLVDGTVDASFTAPTFDNIVFDVSIAPNGQIMAAGSFLNVGGQRRVGLVRFTASNVLAIMPRHSALTAAYPIPAHAQLHLQLDATAQPLRVALIDAMGKTVLNQAVVNPDMTLGTDGLRPGSYVLRVDYANGPVTRRILIE